MKHLRSVKTKPTRARPQPLTDKVLDQILSARPYMTKGQMAAIKESASGNGIGYARRVGLSILTMSVPKLRKSITKDDNKAAAFADAHARLLWVTERQKELTSMLENAHIRLLAAFTDRPDADQLMNTAKSEFDRPN